MYKTKSERNYIYILSMLRAHGGYTIVLLKHLFHTPVFFCHLLERVGELFSSASLNKKHSLEICGA